MKSKYINLLIIFAFTLIATQAKSQQAEAYAKADTNTIMIGDQIGLQFGIKLPKDFHVSWPVFADTLTKNIEIIKKLPVDTTVNGNNKLITQRIVITSFDSGAFSLPPFHFVFYHKNDTTPYILETEPILLKVNVPAVDTTKAFKPIVGPLAEPVTLSEVLPWIVGGLLIIMLVAFAIYYYKRKRAHKPVFARKPKPLPPPHVEALTKLEELRLAKLWQAGKLKEYHSDITDIMRTYLKRRYGFDAVEMTTDEIFEVLKTENVNEQAFNKLNNVFVLADLVKFAKAQPTALENDQSIYDCIDFVNETKYVPQQNLTEKNTETYKNIEEGKK